MPGGQRGAVRQAEISFRHSFMMQLRSVQVPIWPIAQLITWSTKKRTSAHAWATQSAMQVNETTGGDDISSRQPKVQVTTSMQVTPGQVPQSPGQLVQLSNSSASHTPFPQKEHAPQSRGQLLQVSPRRG